MFFFFFFFFFASSFLGGSVKKKKQNKKIKNKKQHRTLRSLVDEEDDAALRVLHLLDHRLEALLELAAVLGARDERADVERDERAADERGGDVAGDDSLREALGDGGLADARLRSGGWGAWRVRLRAQV
jgi:hypothetical protein